VIRPLLRELAIAYYEWAEHDMGPTHPDLPYVLHRLRDLREERHARPGIYPAIWRWL
jgi:hypothetical protein